MLVTIVAGSLCKRHAVTRPLSGIGLRPLVGMWFQVQCPPLIGVLPNFRSRYYYAIGHQRVFSLGGWSRRIRTHFHVLSPTQEFHSLQSGVGYGAFTRCGRSFQTVHLPDWILPWSYNPERRGLSVWAGPRSLAATDGITVVFSSSRYLDVSVPWVGSGIRGSELV